MIETLSKQVARVMMNQYGSLGIPFLFVIDFEMDRPIVLRLDELDERLIRYSFNAKEEKVVSPAFQVPQTEIFPVSFEEYQKAFNLVSRNIQEGNTYLTNLTFPTLIKTSWTLQDIYQQAYAKYKLWLKDHFVIFSPEPFVHIENGVIASFPMKGTIDASIPGALEILETDIKERAEHATIVDLIRNDLNKVATRVGVERYRYFEKVKTGRGALIQSSSHIRGQLPEGYLNILGDILFELLPAGSVTGAPKKKTVEIIKMAEPYHRGYYTGVFGVFDGKNLESAVSIRFIEQNEEALWYKSGGGITTFSKSEAEYKELLDKVYLPINNHLNHEHGIAAPGNHSAQGWIFV